MSGVRVPMMSQVFFVLGEVEHCSPTKKNTQNFSTQLTVECGAHALNLLALDLSLILLYSYRHNASLRAAAVQAAGEAP